LKELEALILQDVQTDIPLLTRVAEHILRSGGKRLRPLLVLLGARSFGTLDLPILQAAQVVEYLHTATLLHDDVVDGADMRRSQQAARTIWGNEASVLVGDYLFSRSFRLMVESESLKVLDVLANASAVIAEGEVAQLTTANDTTTSEEAYLYVIRSKTAALFAAACEVGGLIAGQSETVTNALEQYGANLGIAFQLVDDYLDYASSAEAMGKKAGDDFRDGKITLPIVLAMRRGDDEERSFWQRTLEEGEQKDADLEHAADLLQKHDALTDTLIRASGYADTARAALSDLPDNDHRDALEDVIDFCVDRAY